jgi:hypothetical protein
MRRYEYKIVPVKASGWTMHSTQSQEALLEVLNREGRNGWHVVITQQPGIVPWNSMLLERALD